MSSLGAGRWAALWLSWGAASALVACTRPAVASLLPVLELGCAARRRLSTRDGVQLHAERRWDTVAFVGLRFRPRSAAAELPVRAELAPETWLAPCDSDDLICLQEAADAETEIANALGELQ
jgi:hypothetical protein